MAKPSNSEGLKGPSTDQIKMGESLRHADHAPPGEKHVSQAAYEPYTTPKDYKPPTMKEQWLYVSSKDPEEPSALTVYSASMHGFAQITALLCCCSFAFMDTQSSFHEIMMSSQKPDEWTDLCICFLTCYCFTYD